MERRIEEVARRAREAFGRAFGGEARWGAFAPGRVNLIGEHTDYNGGFVLPIAIDRECVAVAGPRTGTGVRVFSADVGAVAEARESREVERGSWSSYVLGVAAQLRWPAVDIAVASSVPLGAGLSSSAALQVAVATVLEEATGRRLGDLEKAKECQKAEHEFAGVPCGLMDQLTSVMGQAGHALLIDCRSEEVKAVRMPEGVEVLVVNSNVRHVLADGEYGARRKACERAAKKMGVTSLREARLEGLGVLTEEEARCARHVITENERTVRAGSAMEAGNVAELGRLMRESHGSLKDDYRVSCEELDFLAEGMGTCEGVYGARMTGGGFGGSVVAIVESGQAERALAGVLPEYERRFRREATAMVVKASDGARVISRSGCA